MLAVSVEPSPVPSTHKVDRSLIFESFQPSRVGTIQL